LFELSSNLIDVIEDQFYERWKMLTINLHHVKVFLNPYLLGEVCLHDDENVKEALNKVLQKIIHSPTLLEILSFATNHYATGM
jgi:hypothetical protein